MRAAFLVEVDDEWLINHVLELFRDSPESPPPAREHFASRCTDVAGDELALAFYGWPVTIVLSVEGGETMHVAHDDVHDVGLQDNCPGCAEHAENPLGTLDERMLDRLIRSAVARASSGTTRGVVTESGLSMSRADADVIAETRILNVLEKSGRIAEVAPDALERYLRERWKITCRIGRA